MIVVITGLPGAGKTRLALALGGVLSAKGEPVFVLHTDVLKVTMRALGRRTMLGPGYEGFAAKRREVAPLLAAQAEKAERDGYHLIIEGTLATGFVTTGCLYVSLDVAEEERARRVGLKSPRASAALAEADLDELKRALAALAPSDALHQAAAKPAEVLAAALANRIGGIDRARAR